ncbi:MAG: aminomethyl-transferring glycine dehydrogenase [Chloroflexi bacterium HGW-Chloroflexi-5]|jgi:glycine dehydrogenase subunit 1|nr:MAG: aminomethyl-transferring glycine dehydrogenase [Chloroflexi bacterium HGW-Chloroflexi-5]
MFSPHTPSETEEMLKNIGVKSIEDLFKDVPQNYRFPKLSLPEGLTEMEALAEMHEYAGSNETVKGLLSFLGAGAYHHYIPAGVDSLLRRSEFYTAYTPYQPEVAQGTLQAIFEFQTLIANLTGMEVSNASHYDGATATAEAGVMAYHNFRGKRPGIVLSSAVNPQYREVLCSYLCGYENINIQTLGEDFTIHGNPDDLAAHVDNETALVVVQYPDFFGRIFDLTAMAQKVHEKGSLLAVVTNPIALGLLKTPGEMGADIVVGEGQPLGIPLSYGGPYLGFFATKKEFARKISGRLVGETSDAQGRRGYVLTLTAREQHIRREKSTSNICTNQGLMALAATIYLSLVGKSGLKQVANLCFQKAHYAADVLGQVPGFSVLSDAPFFHEFILKCPRPVEAINALLLERDIIGGYDLGKDCEALANHMLICVTEMTSKDDIDYLASVLEEVTHD